jgi:hypothetical protein
MVAATETRCKGTAGSTSVAVARIARGEAAWQIAQLIQCATLSGDEFALLSRGRRFESCRARQDFRNHSKIFEFGLQPQFVSTRQRPSFSAWQTAWQAHSRGRPRGSNGALRLNARETATEAFHLYEAHDA